MKCPNCGNTIYENSRFCTACGTPVAQMQQPAPGYVEAPQRQMAPVQQPYYGGGPAYMTKKPEKYGIWTALGVVGAVVGIMSMFLEYIKVSFYGTKIAGLTLIPPDVKVFDYSMSSYASGMSDDVKMMMFFAIPVIVLILIALILLLCKKRVAFGILSFLSLAAAGFVMLIFFLAYQGYSDVSFSIAPYLSIIGPVLMIIATFIKA